MAAVDLAPKRRERTREDLALIDEIAQDVILVDEGDIDIEKLQDPLELAQGQLTGRQLHLALEDFRLHGR